MRARTVLPVLAVAAAAALAAPPAAAAPPPQPVCGSTLTVDTALRADLTCTGPGLRLAPGVSLDLRGHTLRGPGSGVGVEVASEGAAVVRRGTLAGWGAGVRTYGVEDAETGPLTVERVTFRDNAEGLDASGESGTGRFRKPTTVTRSTFSGNGTAVNAGWFVDVTVDRTTFTDNRAGLWLDGGGGTVTDSRFVRNGRALIVTEASADVSRTTFVDNPTAITATGIIAGVDVADSRFAGGDVAVDGTGAVLGVSGSTFTGSTTAVLLGGFGGSVVGSTFRANGTGITSASPWADVTLVEGNVLRGNGDGIRLDPGDPNITVARNDVRGSTGWGIYAPGVTDGGGNTARGNGNEPQCVGVDCGGPRS